MENIIEIKNLKKYFKDVKAVDDISFEVKKGSLFAFLGLNGAGKSTTINVICGNLIKDEGTVIIDGVDIDQSQEQAKTKLGVVYQNSILDKPLSVKENLQNKAALYGIYGAECKARIEELSKILEMDDYINRPLGKLSGGQKRKVDIARALIHKPQILILDEPTTGLDPQTRKIVWQVIEKLRKEENITVFLTTHYMEEAADADYVVILDNGKVSAEGTPLELKNTYTGDYISLYNIKEEQLKELNLNYSKVADFFRIEVSSPKDAAKLIAAHPDLFVDFEVTKGKMDDVFLSVTGKHLIGGANNENAK